MFLNVVCLVGPNKLTMPEGRQHSGAAAWKADTQVFDISLPLMVECIHEAIRNMDIRV